MAILLPGDLFHARKGITGKPAGIAEPADKPAATESAYAVLRYKDFTRYLIGRFVASLGQQMLVVAIDWELYQRTHSALALAFVGLSLMVPMILCTIPAGHFADIYNRKKIILTTTLILAVASAGLAVASKMLLSVGWIYFFLAVIGAARTFLWPASAAFVTGLVPRKIFARAVTFNSGAFQFSAVVGPVGFGLIMSQHTRDFLEQHLSINLGADSAWSGLRAERARFAALFRAGRAHQTYP